MNSENTISLSKESPLDELSSDLENRRKQQILSERARELAKIRATTLDEINSTEILEFNLSGERYAIEMSYIREVSLLKEITTLPGTPSFIIGIISLRGQVISIVDIKIILGLPTRGITDYNRVIVLQSDTISFGILADAIIMTRRINLDKINRPPPTVNNIGASYLLGIIPGPLMVIDAKTMLNDPHLIVGME